MLPLSSLNYAYVGLCEKMDFVEKVRQLLFSEEEPQFYSLFCQFTQGKGTWHSFLREQSKMEIQSLKFKNNTEAMKDMQVEFIENGKLKKRSIIIGTGLEFEIAVFSFCALSYKEMEKWKHCSAPIDGGYLFNMGIKKSMKSGRLNIIWNTKIMKREKGKPKTDPAFQKLVDQLWENDVDRIDESAIRLNWQGNLEKNQIKDISSYPLFSYVDESTIFQKPIYAAFLKMYKENNFYEQVCEQEPNMNKRRRSKFAKIWKLITESKVFKLGYEFLQKNSQL
uniref:EndoU domain-containing protein n=2 Tax=Meloidogyne TaxID=189290 RepID=A0A6V7V8V2_MELEN|nr:unnamed protein product [Meloidogyne enterolobii]